MFFKEFVAMDITGSEVRVMSVRRKKVRKCGSEPLREGLVKSGIIIEPQTVGLVIDNLFKSLQLPRDRVICTITGLPFIYRVINMPDSGGVIDKEALERAARKEMLLTEPDMYLIWQPTEYHPEKKERDYFVMGIPKNAMKALSDTLAKANIKPYKLDVKPLALPRVVSSGEVIVVGLEKTYADISIVSRGVIRVIHSFALESKPDNDQAIALEVANGLSKAEKSYNRDFPGSPLSAETPVLVAGELAGGNPLLPLIQQLFGHPVNQVTSPLELPPEIEAARYAANLGLIFKVLSPVSTGLPESTYRDINLDLFAGLRKPSALRFKASYAYMAVGFIALAGLLYYSISLNAGAARNVENLKKQSASVAAQLASSQKTNKDSLALQKSETDSLANMQKKLDSLATEHKSIFGLQDDYAGWVKFVSNSLPTSAQYLQMTLNKATINVKGGAADPSLVLYFTEELEAENKVSSARINSITPVQSENLASQAVTFMVDIKK